ncbi:hypothetical protein BH24ACT5_BH24ACT5_03980 [soil metagenome]
MKLRVSSIHPIVVIGVLVVGSMLGSIGYARATRAEPGPKAVGVSGGAATDEPVIDVC